MKIKALISFAGAVSMRQSETRDVSDDTAKDLVRAGYAEKVAGGKAETEAKEK